MSRKQLEQFAEDYYQKYQNAQHNAELYLNQLNRLKNDKYGKKSEKISTIQPTLDLFDEADELAAADEYNELFDIDIIVIYFSAEVRYRIKIQ